MSNAGGWATFVWIVFIVAGAANILYGLAPWFARSISPMRASSTTACSPRLDLVIAGACRWSSRWPRLPAVVAGSCHHPDEPRGGGVVFYLLYVPCRRRHDHSVDAGALRLVAHSEDYA